PMAFDIAKILANLLLALFASPGHEQQNPESPPRQQHRNWLLQCVDQLWSKFAAKFTAKWSSHSLAAGSCPGRLMGPDAPASPEALRDYQESFMAQLWLDVVGFMGKCLLHPPHRRHGARRRLGKHRRSRLARCLRTTGAIFWPAAACPAASIPKHASPAGFGEDSKRSGVMNLGNMVKGPVESTLPFLAQDAYVNYLAEDANGAVAKFLDDPSCAVLAASVSGLETGQLQLQLAASAEYPEKCEYQIILTKLRPGPLTAEDIPANIGISTVSHSPLSSLYHCLRDVYSPLFDGIQRHKTSPAPMLEPHLVDLLVQVQAGLGAAVRKGPAAVQVADPNQAPLQDILTPLDEVVFWSELATSSGPTAHSAQQVAAYMESLRSPLTELQQAIADSSRGQIVELEGGWEGVKELIDQALACLRDVWPLKLAGASKFAMGQKRVENFLRVLAAAIASYIQTQLRGLDVWVRPFSELRGALIGASQVMARLSKESRDQVQEWTHDRTGHVWVGGPYSDPFVLAFQARLEEIYHMREGHDDLSRLLGPDEAAALGAREVFMPMVHLAALQVSEFTAPAWQAARVEYERRMAPLEQRISQKLRELFGAVIIPSLMAAVSGSLGSGASSTAAQPQQVFQELKRYGALLGRPTIAATLSGEKEALAKQIDKHLDNLQSEFDAQRSKSDSPNKRKPSASDVALGRSSSGIADKIMWAMKCLHRLSKVQEVVQLMLGQAYKAGAALNGGSDAGSGLRNCSGAATELEKEVEAYRKEMFDAWEAATQESLSDMGTWKNSRLMTFDSQNLHVKTHFNDQLVVLLREVRQLQSLGFPIRKEIMYEVETANKFYRQGWEGPLGLGCCRALLLYGMVLKQRANFYNNIATEMIPCQKPMLLNDAVAFEKVLMNPKDSQGKDITWRNAAALEGYVRRLNDVADRLAGKNRNLRKWHDVMRDKVVTLMGTDLVRYKDRWALGVKEMRDVFVRMESEGHSRESQQVWRQHWDFQLYKALEYQYIQGLECINRTLPEQEVRMVFRQHKLQYDPPLEELRTKHYKDNLNTFLGLPLRMKGVSDLSERPGFFRPIMDSNPAGIACVYAAAEALFNQLAEELKKYQDWVVLGTAELDEFVDEALSEVADWELNFKVLKAAARDAEKLPNEIKASALHPGTPCTWGTVQQYSVDCYTVSLLHVKACVDEQMKRLQEALIASLRRKAVAEKEQIEEFMRGGKELFNRQASTVEEIGKAGLEARGMVDGLAELAQVKRRIEEKNKLLRAMAAGTGREAAFAAVDLTEANAAWEAFSTQLQQFDANLEEQKTQLATAIEKQVDEYKGKLAGFASRWSELKPRSGPSGNPAVVLARIEEYAAAIKDLREEAARVAKEADAFKIEAPDLSSLNEVEQDVLETKASWDRYAEFLRERNDMANKDWLSMRDQVWRIEDFLAKWGKATEGKGADDPIALILLKEVDSYKRCLPYLKTTLRGAGWEESHWLQASPQPSLFQMLGLQTSGSAAVTRETVTLAHFLDCADAVVKHADAIKAMDAQAQGEALIRKALAELKIWGLQRVFAITEASQQVTTRNLCWAIILRTVLHTLLASGPHQASCPAGVGVHHC
ncbi:hypothetical protein QJQ45_029246, partial [Haematococcus lacustris]